MSVTVQLFKEYHIKLLSSYGRNDVCTEYEWKQVEK